MYFSKFPPIIYDRLDSNNNLIPQTITDVTLNVRLRKQLLDNITVFDEYDIKEGETPEIIAEKIYGNPELHWIIMLANERYDHIRDFPLNSSELADYVVEKYGQDYVDGVHHYEDVRGLVTDASGILSILISDIGPDISLSKYDIVQILDNDTVIGTGKIDAILETIPITETVNLSVLDDWTIRPIIIDLYNDLGTNIGTADVVSYGPTQLNLTNMNFLGTYNKSSIKSFKLGNLVLQRNISGEVFYKNLLVYLESGRLSSNSKYRIKSLVGDAYETVYEHTGTDQSPVYFSIDPIYTVITNFEFEFRENEKKRRIKIINKAFVPEILREFNALL